MTDQNEVEGGDLPDDVADARAQTRAEGRPPEESDSDDPTAQSDTILLESETRLQERSAEAGPR